MSPMVTLNFMMINLTVIFCFVWVQQIHVIKVLFSCCCLLLFQNLGLFIKSDLLKRKQTWVCDHLDEVAGYHWWPKWVVNRIPSSSRVTVMYLDFQSIDFVSRANYRMVCIMSEKSSIKNASLLVTHTQCAGSTLHKRKNLSVFCCFYGIYLWRLFDRK
mgnify:CR=1 FL=1